MSFIFGLIGIIITIFFVVGTHEFGHFLMARWLGVKVIRFSIGFGKVFFKFHDKRKTEYAFSILPLGGYVKMLDENEGTIQEADLPFAYNRQPFYKKFLIVLAGPLTNLISALLLYWIIFVIGFDTVIPRIGEVTKSSFADRGGLTSNDIFDSIDGRKTQTWPNVIFSLLTHAGDPTPVVVEIKKNLHSSTTIAKHLNLKDWQIKGLIPDPLGSLGIIPYAPAIPLTIGQIAKDSPASKTSLAVGDKLIMINKKVIAKWEDVFNDIYQHPDEKIILTIERHHTLIKAPVHIGYKREFLLYKRGYLGISPTFNLPKDFFQNIQYPPFLAALASWNEVRNITYFNLLLFKKLISGDLSLETLGGPITIFESAGSAFNIGLISFLSFLAFLSISVGIINLFPIPGLDGGHLLIQSIEAIIQRPLPEKIIINLYRVGFLFLFFILLQAMVNDILRLYQGS